MDPDMFPSISLNLDVDRDAGKRAQAAGVSTAQWQGATPEQKRELASYRGTAQVREQNRRRNLHNQGYSNDQINMWDKVNRMARERVPENLPSINDVSDVPRSERYEPQYEKAVGDVVRELGWNDAKLLGDDDGGFLSNFGKVLGLPDKINMWAVEKLGDVGFYEEEEVKQAREHEGSIVFQPFEEGAETIRPVAEQMLTGIAEPFEQGEMGFEAVSGIHSRGVSGAIKGDTATDILSEVINPANVVMMVPLAGQGIRAGMSARMVAAKLVDNLVGTGMTPELVQGTARVLSVAGRRGFKVGQITRSELGNLPEGWRELPGDVEGLPPTGIVQAETQSGPIRIQATRKSDEDILWIDVFSAEDASLVDMFNSFREVGRLVGANPNRTFRSQVTNEKLRDILRRAGIKEVPGGAPEALTGFPPAELERLAEKYPIFEFGLDDIARFFPQEVDEVLGGFENLQKARTLRGGPPSPSFQEFEQHYNEMSHAVGRSKKTADYIREEVAQGRMDRRAMDEATVRLSDARKDLRTARRDLNTARYKNAREEILEAAKAAGADERVLKLLGDAFDDSVARVPSEELLLNASGLRHWIANATAHLTGTPPGVLGRLAHHRDILLSALRRNSGETVHPVLDRVEDLMMGKRKAGVGPRTGGELDNIRYVGPKKWAELAEGEFKPGHIIQHPEWYEGMSPALREAMEEAQDVMRKRLETAKALGYPIEALDKAYLEQLWEVPHANVGAAYLPGRVSVAKPKLFDDYFTGMTQGYVPQTLSVSELMKHSTGLLDQAISDAWMKQEVVRRFGSKYPGKAAAGRAKFEHALYKTEGWYGPTDVVSWLDEMEQPIGRRMRQASNISARVRGTVFGIADIAVTGVQFPLSLAHGGLPAAAGAVLRSLNAAGFQPMHLYLDNATFLGRAVQATSDGLHVGLGPSAITLRGGTVTGYIPGIGKLVDEPLSKAIDLAAQAQFGHALSHVRLRMYEGNLIALKLSGQDISQKAVRRFAAEWANSATGASRGAMVKGRRTLESIALTSTQMTRANLSVYGQMIKSLSPTAGRMERLRAAMTLANLGAYVYGIQYLFNTVLGDGPQEWVPGRSNWGTIRIGGRTVPIIPQRSVLRGIDKSIKILSEEVGLSDTDRYSIEDIAKVWSQVAVGKANPMLQAPLAAGGYGFEPATGKFEMGGLSEEGRIVGMLPVPPLVEQAGWQERDELSLAIAGLGFNPYDTSSGILLREEFKTRTNVELNWESPAHRLLIDQDKRMSSLWEKSRKESAEYGSQAAITSNEIRQEIAEAEETKGIVRLAEAVRSGDAIATSNWSDKRKEFLIWRAGKWDNKLTGREPRTEIGRLVNQYYAISPDSEEFTDSSGNTNWEAFNVAREEVLDQMPAEDAKAIRSAEKFDSPVAEAVDKQFREAQDELKPYWQVEDETFGKLRRIHDTLRPYSTFQELQDAKEQELLRMGYPQEDIGWRLNRVPVLSEVKSVIQQERLNYRLQHPKVDALLVRWYGNTPVREQGTGRSTLPQAPAMPTRG
jgi:hypothetical protein